MITLTNKTRPLARPGSQLWVRVQKVKLDAELQYARQLSRADLEHVGAAERHASWIDPRR